MRIGFAEGVLHDRATLDRRIRAILLENSVNLGVRCRDPEDIPTCSPN